MDHVSEAQKVLGELFIIGFEGKKLPDDTSAFISQAGIGGVILFAANYENPTQVAELINEVQECRAENPLWISVDQEGGRVQRFKEGFTLIPPAAKVTQSGSPKLAFEVAQILAKELKAVGINLNFAPVADILTNPKSTAIGDRAFAADEDTVTKMVTAYVRGMVTEGIQPCVKHFPGHGDTAIDSHEELPKMKNTLKDLQDREFRPFVKTFKSRCNMVMVGHLLVESLDPQFPASLSKKILQDVLRNELRYSRIIISDDMEMKAVTKHFGEKDAPRLAIDAGCDLLIYRSEAAGRKAYTSVLKALEDGKLSPKPVLEAAERLRNLKKEVLYPYQPTIIQEVKLKVGLPEHKALVEKLKG